MATKSVNDILTSIKKRIAYQNPTLDLTSGNVSTDLGIEAFAEELAASYTEEDRIRLLYLFNDSAYTDNEADLLANSFNIYRLSATKATGEVTFGAVSIPEAGSYFTIPAGTAVSTSGDSGAQITYVTTTEATISANTPINPNTNYYEVIVGVQAQVAGSSSNVGPGAINTIKGTVNGISVVYNENAIVNGADTETTAELLTRTKNNLRGFVYGTKASYENKALAYPKVTDAVIVDPDSEFSVRGPGSLDIYIVGETISSYTEQITDKSQTVYLTKNPVIANGQAIVVFTDDGTTISEGNGFSIVRDTKSIYASSSKAKDYITWDQATYQNIVLAHGSYSVTYTYNSLVENLQDYFDSEDNHILTSDILTRDTQRIDVEMDFDIVLKPGYDSASVRNNVIYTIQSFVNNFKLDEALRQSDIIGLVEGVAGVDYVKLPMRKFCVLGQDKVSDVESSPLEYIRVEADNILIG